MKPRAVGSSSSYQHSHPGDQSGVVHGCVNPQYVVELRNVFFSPQPMLFISVEVVDLISWLDDEWSLQEPHKELGLKAAEKCTEMRLEGCEEMGSLVMGVAADLIDFDFSDTFVNAFEVANKCSEILMMREGYEVCCINKDDETRQARYEEMVANGEM